MPRFRDTDSQPSPHLVRHAAVAEELDRVSGAAESLRHLHQLLFKLPGEVRRRRERAYGTVSTAANATAPGPHGAFSPASQKLKRKAHIRQFRGFDYTDKARTSSRARPRAAPGRRAHLAPPRPQACAASTRRPKWRSRPLA